MTGGAVMTAMRRRGAPQVGQVRTSTANTRANKVAHGRPWRAEPVPRGEGGSVLGGANTAGGGTISRRQAAAGARSP